MSAVVVAMSMSLDGYVAQPNDDPGVLHEWMFRDGADAPGEGMSGPDKEQLDELRDSSGAMISGRRLWDLTHGWAGSHPFAGITLFVVSHDVPDAAPSGSTPVRFVTDGVESAVAQARRAAGTKNVYVVGGASIDQQLLEAGLVDELWITVVPVLLGDGIRLFERLGGQSILLEQQNVTASDRVAHLRYTVRS